MSNHRITHTRVRAILTSAILTPALFFSNLCLPFAQDWPEVEFFEILFDNNKQLCKSLNIKILPYIEIVSGKEGKVEGFSCGPSKIQKLEEKLQVSPAL